jgi:hypothetical protein
VTVLLGRCRVMPRASKEAEKRRLEFVVPRVDRNGSPRKGDAVVESAGFEVDTHLAFDHTKVRDVQPVPEVGCPLFVREVERKFPGIRPTQLFSGCAIALTLVPSELVNCIVGWSTSPVRCRARSGPSPGEGSQP